MSINEINKIGVLLVENNPLDRLVIDELLADSDFRLRYSVGGVPVNEVNPWGDESTNRLLFEELLEEDFMAEDYEIVLLDLGLDRTSEDILASPDFKDFLASLDEVAEICLFKWEDDIVLSDDNLYHEKILKIKEKILKIKGLEILLDRTKTNLQRVFVVISHFVDTSNDESIRRLLTNAYDPMLVHFHNYKDCDEVCSEFRGSIENLVMNKADLNELPVKLKKAYNARKNFCQEVVKIGEFGNFPAYQFRDSKISHKFSDVVASELLFRGNPNGGPRLILFLDYMNYINFKSEAWERIYKFAIGDCNRICTNLNSVESTAASENIVMDLPCSERDGTIFNTIDRIKRITEENGRVVLCRLQVQDKELKILTDNKKDLANIQHVSITLLLDETIEKKLKKNTFFFHNIWFLK